METRPSGEERFVVAAATTSDEDSSNPFAILGLTKTFVRALSRDLSRETLSRFRRFLTAHVRAQSHYVGGDTGVVEVSYTQRFFQAQTILSKADLGEIQEFAREYLEGSEQEAFTIRTQLQNHIKRRGELDLQVTQLQASLDRQQQLANVLAGAMSRSVVRLLQIIGCAESAEGKKGPFDFRGYSFFGLPDERSMCGPFVRLIEVPMYYIRPDGVMIKRQITLKHVRKCIKPDEARKDLHQKAISAAELLYENEYDPRWTVVGPVIGFTNTQTIEAKRKFSDRLGRVVQFRELSLLLEELSKTEVEDDTQFNRLVTIRTQRIDGKTRYVCEATQFMRSPYAPIAPPW